MADFLAQLDYLNGPGAFEVQIPAGTNGLKNGLSGTLEVSREGYVYSASSKAVVWLKFLGLGVYLPIKGTVSKCVEIASKCFGCAVPEKGYHDLKHILNLAKIAWKGVLDWDHYSLMERVEEYALSELDYNNSDRASEMSISRSQRFTQGFYVAKCMQPLFHRDQFHSVRTLNGKIEALDQHKKQLAEMLAKKRAQTEGLGFRKILSYLPSSNPYKDWSIFKIQRTLQEIDEQNNALKEQREASKKCEKYALKSIFKQQYCQHAVDALVDTQAEVSCCGERCFRQQRICGLLYKIDCCATRCWALDCFCCMCCIWPDAQSVCVIT